MSLKKIGSKISDRTWIILILIALVIESVWLLSELGIIRLPFREELKKTTGIVEAGKILKAHENLKRRSGSGLIWEPAKQDEILYYKDSLLTLSRSSATLYLKDQTELQMSENTLVTLEPPEENSNAEIRLRFAKGDVKARNPFNKAAIQSTDWVVNLEKGAEVAMRKGQNEMEFEVLAGKAVLSTESGTQELVESKIVKLGDDKKIETIEKSLGLQWKKPQPERIYTFNTTAKVPLEWKGSAEKINIGKVGQPELPEEKPIVASVDSTDLELPHGSYQIRLKDQNGISNAKEVEVFPAPKIILKKPLPRDRIQIGVPQEFVWSTEAADLKGFQLKLSDGQNFEVTNNFKSLQFDEEQDIVWRIEGVDRDGYKIPSFYESKVYLRKDALAAPKLKKPVLLEDEGQNKKQPEKKKLPDSKLNKSAPSGYLYLQNMIMRKIFTYSAIFINLCQAQVLRKQNVIFEWEAVEGANQYIIEISSDPEFKTPEVMETLKSTKYIWKKYDPKKKYWWRVASGHSSGRMGLFSDPTELEVVVEKVPQKKTLEEPVPDKKEVPAPVVEVVSKEATAAVSTDASQANLSQTSNDLTAEEKIYQEGAVLKFAYAPGFKQAVVPGDQQAQIELNGAVPTAFEIRYQTENKNNLRYFADLYLSSQKWKPETGSSGTQEDLNFNEFLFLFRAANNLSRWQYGLFLRQTISAERTLTGVKNLDLWLTGISISRVMSDNWQLDLGYSVGGKYSEFNGALRYTKYFSENLTGYFWGSNLVVNLQSGPSGQGSQNQLQLVLGKDLF